jgi:hypothetical protein
VTEGWITFVGRRATKSGTADAKLAEALYEARCEDCGSLTGHTTKDLAQAAAVDHRRREHLP